MKLLEERIRKDGVIIGKDVLMVDSFINHQIDVGFSMEMAKEFKRLFEGEKITKVLTIEASGIAIATLVAYILGVPLVFAKKSKTSNVGEDIYSARVASYTHGNVNNVIVSKKYLTEDDNVLIIDDFLAEGNALIGLIDLCGQASAKVVGCGIIIEKAFQQGGERVRKITRVCSLARIEKMDENGIVFVDE